MNDAVLKNVLDSLDMMWKGMLGLFLVCGAVALLTIIIAKCVKLRAEKTDSNENIRNAESHLPQQ
jgi:hypothetical protein